LSPLIGLGPPTWGAGGAKNTRSKTKGFYSNPQKNPKTGWGLPTGAWAGSPTGGGPAGGTRNQGDHLPGRGCTGGAFTGHQAGVHWPEGAPAGGLGKKTLKKKKTLLPTLQPGGGGGGGNHQKGRRINHSRMGGPAGGTSPGLVRPLGGSGAGGVFFFPTGRGIPDRPPVLPPWGGGNQNLESNPGGGFLEPRGGGGTPLGHGPWAKPHRGAQKPSPMPPHGGGDPKITPKPVYWGPARKAGPPRSKIFLSLFWFSGHLVCTIGPHRVTFVIIVNKGSG